MVYAFLRKKTESHAVILYFGEPVGIAKEIKSDDELSWRDITPHEKLAFLDDLYEDPYAWMSVQIEKANVNYPKKLNDITPRKVMTY